MSVRNVRNFWIEIEVDGKKERIATGPVRADGGFTLTIKQRAKGEIAETLLIEGRATGEGGLTLAVVTEYLPDGRNRLQVQTCR